MAAPAYTEDLTDIHLMESVTNVSALGGGGAGLTAGIDFAIQGTNSVSKTVTGVGVTKGMVADNGAGITMGASDHLFAWVYSTTQGVLDTLANGGMRVTIGTSTGNYNDYYVAGSDTYQKGGHICWPIRYATGTPSPGSQTGTPGANPQWFGGQLTTIGTLRADDLAVDALRYGTGAYITAGEVADPATFSGFATQNDAASNQWGILTAIPGGFGLQGRFVVGQDNAATATLAYFKDSDIAITLTDTPHSQTDFTQIIIDHASTTFDVTNMNLTALGTNNPGKFVVNSADPIVNVTGGTWTSIGTTVLRSNSAIDGLTWRLCDSITCNQATLDNCVIDRCTATSAVLTDDLGDLTLNNFIGDNTGHAVELSSIGAGSMTWNNTFDTATYAAIDGSTGNEAVYVNVASGSLTINVTAGATTPTIRTAGAVITVVAGAVTVSAKVTDSDGVDIQNANVLIRASDATGAFPYRETVTITRVGAVATVAHTAHGMATNDKTQIRFADQPEYNGVHQITLIDANSYSYAVAGTPATPATGTIKATFVALQGLTDVNGEISTSRVYATAQPVTGWARKSTASPYFKQGGISGTIETATGFAATAQLVSDE